MATMFWSKLNDMKKFYSGPSLDASSKILLVLAKRFQRRRYLEIDQPETRIAYGGQVCKHIGTKLAIFIEDLLLDASYQVSLAMQFERRSFKYKS